MRFLAFFAGALFFAQVVWTDTPSDRISVIVDELVLPGYSRLAAAGEGLAEAAQSDCSPETAQLREAYHAAFDAWIAVSHMRFGPSETDNRAFALAFWPDTRGKTAKALNGLIAKGDPVVSDPLAFAEVSVAGRGLFALEYLQFDDRLSLIASADYHCSLVQAVATDIARTTAAIHEDWTSGYADALRSAGTNDWYQSREEALQEFFKALSTGLQFTSEARLGRPLGTFQKPRPKRAEAWRSGRSLRNVEGSLAALRPLAAMLAQDEPNVAVALDRAFQKAIDRAEALDDPVFAGVSDPQGRVRIEALQQAIDDIRLIVSLQLGPSLGVAAGFNSLDGD